MLAELQLESNAEGRNIWLLPTFFTQMWARGRQVKYGDTPEQRDRFKRQMLDGRPAYRRGDESWDDILDPLKKSKILFAVCRNNHWVAGKISVRIEHGDTNGTDIFLDAFMYDSESRGKPSEYVGRSVVERIQRGIFEMAGRLKVEYKGFALRESRIQWKDDVLGIPLQQINSASCGHITCANLWAQCVGVEFNKFNLDDVWRVHIRYLMLLRHYKRYRTCKRGTKRFQAYAGPDAKRRRIQQRMWDPPVEVCSWEHVKLTPRETNFRTMERKMMLKLQKSRKHRRLG